ncbi:MAG: type III pantothenate kinase [Verrucomicrobia bacterium]|jgi:type III pantothenate kinase|nr:type III pantothenate kinase [Verrucomicrobiota bacterium]
MYLLLDIGNTHTHAGLANHDGILDQIDLPTQAWKNASMPFLLQGFCQEKRIEQAAFCSVVPQASEQAREMLARLWKKPPFELTCQTLWKVGIDYPIPSSVGADRLANAIALAHYYGFPSVGVDFGTAVTFDIVNAAGNYAGGIIAPGLATMTTYLHEKTAQLPCIEIWEMPSVVGKSTADAMRIGAVHGYRGLIKELIKEIKNEFQLEHLPFIATGGYSKMISEKIPDITCVDPELTLKGLLLALLHSRS